MFALWSAICIARVISLMPISRLGILTTPLLSILFVYAPEIETITFSYCVPATLFASFKAFLIDFEASSMFVIMPFLRPCDFAIPAPRIFIPSSLCSAMIAQILLEPISIPKIVVLNYFPL